MAAAPSAAGPLPIAELLAALPVAMLVIDGEGRVCEGNGAAETLLNLARAALIGRGIERLIGHPLTSMAPDQPFAAFDLDIILPGGRAARVDLAVAPLPERKGWRILTIHGRASHDASARRGDRAGRVLPAAAAAALLAHEVKNPLSGIRGAAQLLESDAAPEQRALTRLIRDEVDRIAGLIDRMEGLTDTRPRPLAPINVHSVLGHVRDVAANGFAAGCTLREAYDPSLPEILGNRDALVQILLNLLKNAAEAAGPGGTITLRTAYRHGLSLARDGGARVSLPIELAVIDDGPGAPAELLDHLFDAFVSSKPSGTGLGLALVEKLIGEMGGIVEYVREGHPECTVFRLFLPRARSARP
ncbi:two-component system sensor histidine kinase NtrB [Sphingomonas morindae]|uniref:histidine kinase n=1 Tax=Sphingomonas morindae TaxID=1541170 RepID=A0ABY4X8H9_9SPHN|nr:ATP-binding protein [Sphingomonas morindae]USI72981.1 PAS domain-containing protein [Sphingomonas morindae]